MAVNYIEFPKELAHRCKTIVNGVAHAVHLVENVTRTIAVDPLVMNSVYLIIRIEVPPAGKDMYLMAPSRQCFRNF
jgi:hypothetical protein